MPPIDFAAITPEREPFAHAVVDGVFDAETYRALEAAFPDCPPGSGPTGYTIHRGDALYNTVMAREPAWRALSTYCNSPGFVAAMAALFDEDISRSCRIDAESARYADHIETRREKETNHQRGQRLAADQLYVRFDFMQGRESYGREVHLDHRRRLATLLLYFDAPGTGRYGGGELILHDASGAAVKTIEPAPNRGVFFACSERAWHSVAPVTEAQAPRRFVQVSVSSCHDIWPGGEAERRWFAVPNWLARNR